MEVRKSPIEWRYYIYGFQTAHVEACGNITNFTPYAAGGDGGAIPYCKPVHHLLYALHNNRPAGYVGYHSDSKSVVVSNQGTDGTKLYAPLEFIYYAANKLYTFSAALLVDANFG